MGNLDKLRPTTPWYWGWTGRYFDNGSHFTAGVLGGPLGAGRRGRDGSAFYSTDFPYLRISQRLSVKTVNLGELGIHEAHSAFR